VKLENIAYVNHTLILSWNQPVLSTEGHVSCSRKQKAFYRVWACTKFVSTDYTSDRLL